MVRDAGANDQLPTHDGAYAAYDAYRTADDPLVPALVGQVGLPAGPHEHLGGPSPVRQAGRVALPVLDRRWLDAVGFPASVGAPLPSITGDPTMALLQLADRLPRPEALPTHQGSLIAIVGQRHAALEIAESFATMLGTSPDDVLIATRTARAKVDPDRRIDCVDTALEQRRTWRRRRRPTIVAVEAEVGRRQTGWASSMLDAVEPTQVWGVVDATRKAEDIRDWAIRVGGLDALAVTGLDDTASPASVLSVGVPVGLLDGEEATPLRWTTLLAARLEEALA
jgi:hypothetical protein